MTLGGETMKMVKRVGMWLIVLALMCSMAGCTKKPELTPEEVYATACEKLYQLNHLDGIDMEISMDVVVTAEGETREMSLDAALRVEHPNSEAMKMDMSMRMNEAMKTDMSMHMGVPEIKPNQQAYYMDGYYLTDERGEKVKYPMSLEDAMLKIPMMQDLALDDLSDLTMTKEDGLRILTYSVDAKRLMSEEMRDYLLNIPLVVNSRGLTYKEFQGVMKVNEEGYPVDITMKIVYTTWAGAKWDCNATATMVYHDPGQPVTVEIPDASEYIEVDPETMS